MLTPNELQIGDWVHEKYESQYGNKDEYVQVDGILAKECANQHGGNGTIWGKDHGNLGGGDCLYPIPLTAEILEKNGWDVEDTCYAKYDLPGDFASLEFYFHESRLRKWWEGVDEWDNHSEVREVTFQCHCTYVHQLQQALRLCGLTELANNFKL